ncbi:MAG: diaminopimelate decarboxylase, partial [Saprospiraceae bacterium]|nr:diaminopimelate decarboxylase [Saprospiraceae bacterium]
TSTVFAGVDSGFNHLLRPMFYDSYHEIMNVSNPKGTPKIYSVVGYICETDTFAWNRRIPEIHVGDVLAIRNAGAYSFMMASNYNSRLLPAEVLIVDGKDYLVRERQTFDDLLHHQTDPAIPFNAE